MADKCLVGASLVGASLVGAFLVNASLASHWSLTTVSLQSVRASS